MQAFSINLPLDVQQQITSFAQQYGVDSIIASGIAQVSSGGQQFFADGSLVVTTFGVGVMGISKQIAKSLGFDATTQLGNIQAGVAWLSGLVQALSGHYELALAAYVTSVDTVRSFNGIPPLASVTEFVYNISKISANAGSPAVSGLLAVRSEATVDPSPAASISSGIIDPRTTGINYGSGNDASKSAANLNELQATMTPILQVPDVTLQATPWYKDTGLVTGNSTVRASVQPVSFMVYFDRNDSNQFLKNPADNSPIEVQLNTSLSSFEISSKHVYNRTPSRTGMHITLWGMEPDLISGQGSTGVFMNQFGITDFMSVSGINSDIIQLLTTGFIHQFIAADVVTLPFEQSAENIILSQDLNKPNEAFRVAAQDAFIELLKLFQMNGNVWFHSQSYANGTNLGTIGGTQQDAPTAWSSKTGATSFQQHARNNDVMTRGYVSMRYRNNVYLGYFKTLSWTQDAESPFQWKFNFTFQVEKTYTALYYPNSQVQLNQNFLTQQDVTDNTQGGTLEA